MATFKNFVSGALLFAYLVIGSGHVGGDAPKLDARTATRQFAATLPRNNYRYSVVPGGVHSPEELAAARRSDPVVAEHYKDFGTNTWVTTLKEDMWVYVSYRQGNKILTTKTKHKVCKGELVITDGKNFARTKCANRISRVFRAPALAFNEPKAPELDLIDPPDPPQPSDPALASNYYGLPDVGPYVPASLPAQTGATPGPPSPSDAFAPTSGVPSLLPFGAGAPALLATGPLPPPPPPSVPEPATGALILMLSASLLWWQRRRGTR